MFAEACRSLAVFAERSAPSPRVLSPTLVCWVGETVITVHSAPLTARRGKGAVMQSSRPVLSIARGSKGGNRGLKETDCWLLLIQAIYYKPARRFNCYIKIEKIVPDPMRMRGLSSVQYARLSRLKGIEFLCLQLSESVSGGRLDRFIAFDTPFKPVWMTVLDG